MPRGGKRLAEAPPSGYTGKKACFANLKEPTMKNVVCMGVLLCVLLLGLGTGQTAAAAEQDPAFAEYLAAVRSLNMEDMADMQQAARAFAVYAQQVLPANKAALGAHLDTELRVNGKWVKAKDVRRNLDKLFTDTVVKDVQQMSTDDKILIRNMTDCMLGNGTVWFMFRDNDAAQPVISAVNNRD